MTDDTLTEIETRLASATAGPWRAGQAIAAGLQVSSAEGAGICCMYSDGATADATFIAHAREDIPALIAEVRRLREERATLLAPVEGVDVEEVLRLDREGTPAPWRTVRMDCGGYWGVEIVGPNGERVTGETRITSEDRDVVERYRTAAPILAREVARLRARLAAVAQTCTKMLAADGEMVETIGKMRKLWDETKERLKAERVVETYRHEAAMTRLSAVVFALHDETGSAPSITDPPDAWSRAIRAAVCGAKMLAEEAEELRRSEAALLLRPEGGADLGFKVAAGLWWKPLDNGCIEIEDFTRLPHPEGSPFRRAHYRIGEVLAYSFHATPRAAMRAPLT